MEFILSYNNNEMVMPFPVVPNAAIQLKREQSNTTFDGVNYELQAIGTMQLATFEFSSIFPNHHYNWGKWWALTGKGMGWTFVNAIEAARRRQIPFRAIHLDNDGHEIFNLPVTVDSFEWGRDQIGDVSYHISFREYRFAKIPIQDKLPTQKSAKGKKSKLLPVITQTQRQQQASTATSPQGPYQKKYTRNDAVMMAKVMFLESRGIKSMTEIACIGWTILNRVDDGMGSIAKVITAPYQFAYRANAKVISDKPQNYDLVALATDVLDRWSREKAGQKNVGRVLPLGYKWYFGDGRHNIFRNRFKGGKKWNYSLPSPYRN